MRANMKSPLTARDFGIAQKTPWKCFLLLTAILVVCGTALSAQSSSSQSADTDQSWTRTGESRDAFGTQRSVNSHTTSGNRSFDSESITQRNADGRFQTYLDTEKETVHIGSSTTHIITRTFAADGSGGRKLVRVTEEETQALPNGGSKSTRTTSDADVNGNLQQVQREIAETRKIGTDAEQTKTTLFRGSPNGGLVPAEQVEERRQRAGDNTEFHKTTRTLDGSGNWQISEVRQGTIKEDGKNRITDERVSRSDYEGRLSEVSRTVTNDTENASGEKQSTVESYSLDVPGTTRDAKLHLIQRVTTKQGTGPNGQQTNVQQVEQVNPGDPSAGLRVIAIGTEQSRSGQSGTNASRTVRFRNASGDFDVVSVDFSKSDKAAIQVQIAPSNKPK
jgi:hypothetical protein